MVRTARADAILVLDCNPVLVRAPRPTAEVHNALAEGAVERLARF